MEMNEQQEKELHAVTSEVREMLTSKFNLHEQNFILILLKNQIVDNRNESISKLTEETRGLNDSLKELQLKPND